ncbi:MAG TPA: hypothetical protein ENI99_10510 [Sedimenticola sp.]|nr:hypothetical protein [Sedimenticola sp.]
MKVYWHTGGTGFEHYLHGIGLAFWLELKGTPCLHASLLSDDHHTIGLIASSQTGKSTTTLRLMQYGMSLVADDMLPLYRHAKGWRVYPGSHSLRLWPGTAHALMNGRQFEELPRVHEKFEKRRINITTQNHLSICEHPTALSSLYLLSRGPSSRNITIRTLAPSEAIIQLLKHSLIGDAPAALGLEEHRLRMMSRLVEDIPIKLVEYPSGFERLDSMCGMLMEDAGVCPNDGTHK